MKPGEGEGKTCLCLSLLFCLVCWGLLLFECPQKPESRGPSRIQSIGSAFLGRVERVERRYKVNNCNHSSGLAAHIPIHGWKRLQYL